MYYSYASYTAWVKALSVSQMKNLAWLKWIVISFISILKYKSLSLSDNCTTLYRWRHRLGRKALDISNAMELTKAAFDRLKQTLVLLRMGLPPDNFGPKTPKTVASDNENILTFLCIVLFNILYITYGCSKKSTTLNNKVAFVFHNIQADAVITQPNKIRQCIQHCSDWNRT